MASRIIWAPALSETPEGEIGHQQAAVGVDDDMAFTADCPLGSIVTALCARRRSLHHLAVGDAGAGVRFAPGLIAVDHQGDVVDGTEQYEPDEASELPVDRLPRWEALRQHAPAAARARHVPHRCELAHASPLNLNRIFRNRVG